MEPRILKYSVQKTGEYQGTPKWQCVGILSDGRTATVKNMIGDTPPSQGHLEQLIEALPNAVQFSAEPQAPTSLKGFTVRFQNGPRHGEQIKIGDEPHSSPLEIQEHGGTYKFASFAKRMITLYWIPLSGRD